MSRLVAAISCVRGTPSRAARLISLAAIGLVVAGFAGGARVLVKGARAALRPSAVLLTGDTVMVYGPHQFATPTGSLTHHVERFELTLMPGRQYALSVDNGAPDGTLRVSGGTVQLNGTEILSSATLAAGGAGWRRPVEPLAEDTLVVDVEGAPGAYLTISLVTLADPTFLVFGVERFNRTSGPPNEYNREFTVASTAGTPQRMCVINGNADGTERVSGARIWLNGYEVLHPSDLNQNVARVDRDVELQPQNTVLIRVASNPSGFLDLCFTATDVTPPVLTVSPGPGHLTRDTMITISGTVQDETPVQVRVDGVLATMGGGNSYSADVPLPLEGHNTIHVVATDGAGLTTDSARVIIRDSRAPTLTLTAPTDGLITRDDSITVTGSVSDSTAITVNANGLALTLDSIGGFSGRLPLVEGQNFITVTATDTVGNAATVVRQVTRDQTPPVLTLGAPAEGFLTRYDTVTVNGSVSDASPVTVSANGVPLPVDAAGQFAGTVAAVEGPNVITVTATDAAGNSTTGARTGTRDSQAPVITIAAPDDGALTQATTIRVSGTVTDASVVTLTVNGLEIAIAAGGLFDGEVPVTMGPNTLTFVATDAATNSATVARSVTRVPAGPPDPATIATPIVASEASLLQENTAFLYSGTVPVQTGVAPGTITLTRAAALRGRVITRDSQPLVKVHVSIAEHPELGYTETRADGRFDIAVNGGGKLVVDFQKGGYLPAQRTLDVPWQTFTLPDDVVLIQPDTAVTVVDLTSNQVQVARGSIVTDSDGPRRATAIFEPGTQATLVLADGSTQPLTSVAVRATEFTVGEGGEAAMPAPLPPTSHYTYAVQVTADEQLAAGPGSVVTFSRPVPLYVQNFLSIPVGTAVPVGSYDGSAQRWVPENNGVVLKVLGADPYGRALLDINGDGIADADSVLLYRYGIDSLEVVQLAGSFNPGDELWRIQVLRTFPYDLNYGYSIVGGQPPAVKVRGPCGAEGADLLRCSLQVQTAFQRVGLVGSPFTMNYASDRTKGFGADRQLTFQLIDSVVPASLERVDLEIDVAGRRFGGSFLPSANLAYTFQWDGQDVYGRTLQASQPVVARVGYVYPIAYSVPAEAQASFGLTCTKTTALQCILPADVKTLKRRTTTIWETLQSTVGGFDAAGAGLGGFTFDVQHAYDPIGGVLFSGDGTRRAAGSLPEQITAFAGTFLGYTGAMEEGGLATSRTSFVIRPDHLAFGPDGTLYFADENTHRVRKVTGGRIWTVAGSGSGIFGGFSGDGGPATAARLNGPTGVALGPDGSLYILDAGNFRVRKVDPAGIITTIAGSSTRCGSASQPCGDGGPAALATFYTPVALAVGPDGSVYVADQGTHKIRQIGPDGTIRTAIGQATQCANYGGGYAAQCGEGVPGTSVKLRFPSALAVASDGSLYFATGGWNFGERVRRMTPDGIVRTIAGSDNPPSYLGDGGPALQATFVFIYALTVGPDGTVYVAEDGNGSPPHVRVRRIRPDGLITTAVGNGSMSYVGSNKPQDNGPALATTIGRVKGLAVGPDGALYLSDENELRRVSPPLPGLMAGTTVIASEDGSELYVFSAAGRILLTLDAVTGDTVNLFGYNAARQLVSITDRDGRVTQIERDSTGRVTAMIPPDGRQTAVTFDAAGNLRAMSGPDGLPVGFDVSANGLLLGTMDQAGDTVARFAYDLTGTLVGGMNPLGGTTSYGSAGGGQLVTSLPTGQDLSLQRSELSTGGAQLIAQLSGGMTLVATVDADGRMVSTAPDGTVTTTTTRPDPLFGMQAPQLQESIRLPSGLTRTAWSSRTVTVADPTDPLSVVTQVDSFTVNGLVSTATYNRSANTLTMVSPSGRTMVSQMDGQGHVSRVTGTGSPPYAQSFDANGQLDSVSVDGGTSHFEHDSLGRITSFNDLRGLTHSLVYDAANRVIERRMPDGRTIAFGYDSAGNVTSVTPPGRPQHRLQHSRGLLSQYTAPEVEGVSPVLRFSYDSAGRLVEVTRPDSSLLRIFYDTASLSQTAFLPGGDTLTLVRNPQTGTLTRATLTGGANLDLTYDGALLTGTTWSGPLQGRVTRDYDAFFRVRTERVNDASGVEFTFDADGLLTGAGALTLTRDPATGVAVSASLGGMHTGNTYTARYQLASTVTTLGADTLYAVVLGRDSIGRIVSRTERASGVSHVTSFAYDSAARLASVTVDGEPTETYEYGANDNRVRATTPNATFVAATDAQDRLVTYGAAHFSYTPNGELLEKVLGTDTTRYLFDANASLRSVRLPGGTLIEYVVDAGARRIGKKINGTLVKGWLYDGPLAIVAELDGSGQLLSRFVYGERPNVPEYMTRGDSTYRLILDERGSPRLVVNVSSGSVAQRLDYDAFGRVTFNSNPGFQPFGFGGGLLDDHSGLVLAGARDYDPETGRWTIKDPVGFAGAELNLYAYAGNDPVNNTDPTGETTLAEQALVGAASNIITGALLRRIQGFSYEFSDFLRDGILGAAGGLGSAALASSVGSRTAFNVYEGGRGALRRAFVKNGLVSGDEVVHHIVAWAARGAGGSRAVLERFGVSLSDLANGVSMGRISHGVLHTRQYYEVVGDLLAQATSRAEVIDILETIGVMLKSGVFPY